ncbi:hypothetical protein GGP41_003223 [Bipolaris sorokiniana]|uniref:Xylanolytic transcriptional activator regulatory domain-containing protein n=1 Tax=Cochliobolus sativus TaxID=45130 RepID=A0A8H5ZF58_COCSA|nr:hypothetical protein GGP41_003223 [Bipolaris sorokiniana]
MIDLRQGVLSERRFVEVGLESHWGGIRNHMIVSRPYSVRRSPHNQHEFTETIFRYFSSMVSAGDTASKQNPKPTLSQTCSIAKESPMHVSNVSKGRDAVMEESLVVTTAQNTVDIAYTRRGDNGAPERKPSAHSTQQLIHDDLSSGLASAARFLEIDVQRSYNEVHSGRTAQDSGEEQITLRYTAMDDPAQGPWTTEETTRTLPAAAKKFAAFAADVHMTMKQIQTRPVIEEIQLHGVFLEEEIVLRQLDEQYIAGPDDCDSDPCRWMTVCSLLGISTLHRTDSKSLAAISSIAWAFFKNAFAMYAELVVRRPAIVSCEALLVMALFMLRTADAGLAAQLTAAAAHIAHMLGLHKQEYYVGLDADVAERHKRILWVVYILNADVTHRYGLPSPLDEETIVIKFPEVEHYHVFSPGDDTARLARQHQGGILRQQAIFAVVQLRIHKLLERVSFGRLSMQESTDLLEAVTKIHQELEEWKRWLELGARWQPVEHLMCCSACNPNPSHTSARQTLCFPLSAILILLSETLAYPASAHAETDVELIHDFVRYLERLESEGCEVHLLINGCRRFWSIATCALIASQTDGEVTVFEQTRESIYSKLAQVVDWLQLAEGLLSNVPMLIDKARELFCDILEPSGPDERYGDFVPEFLKPSKYGFSVSS